MFFEQGYVQVILIGLQLKIWDPQPQPKQTKTKYWAYWYSLSILLCFFTSLTEDRVTQNQLHQMLRRQMLKWNLITRGTVVIDTHPESNKLNGLVFRPSRDLVSHDLIVDGVKLGADSDAYTSPGRKRRWCEFSSDEYSDTDSMDATTLELGRTPEKRSRSKGITGQ